MIFKRTKKEEPVHHPPRVVWESDDKTKRIVEVWSNPSQDIGDYHFVYEISRTDSIGERAFVSCITVLDQAQDIGHYFIDLIDTLGRQSAKRLDEQNP